MISTLIYGRRRIKNVYLKSVMMARLNQIRVFNLVHGRIYLPLDSINALFQNLIREGLQFNCQLDSDEIMTIYLENDDDGPLLHYDHSSMPRDARDVLYQPIQQLIKRAKAGDIFDEPA